MSTKTEPKQIPSVLVRIAVDATLKIDSLSRVLVELEWSNAEHEVAAIELAGRIRELNEVVMSVISDASPAEYPDLYRQVHREPIPQEDEDLATA
jgi:hypothetical protein